MDFGKNCTVWGNFLSSFYRRDPWQPEYTSFGSYDQTIVLFVESCPDGTLYTGELGEMTEEEQNAKISEWYAWNLYESMDDNGIFTIINKTDPFTIKLFYEPIEKCVDEYCNAMEFTGNPDLTGIGVSRRGNSQHLSISAPQHPSSSLSGLRLLLRRGNPRHPLPHRSYNMVCRGEEEGEGEEAQPPGGTRRSRRWGRHRGIPQVP